MAQEGNDVHILCDLGQAANCRTRVRRMVAPQTPSWASPSSPAGNRVKTATDSIPVRCLYSQLLGGSEKLGSWSKHPALEPGIGPKSPDSQSRSQCKDVAVLTPCPCQHLWGPPGVRKFPHQPLLWPCLLGQKPWVPQFFSPPALGLRPSQRWATSWRDCRKGEQMLPGISCGEFVGQ